MVRVEVKRGENTKTIECEFAAETFDKTFFARFADDRRLPEIAQDFDGADSFTVVEELQTNVYNGYGKLVYLAWADGLATIRMLKDDEEIEEGVDG